MCVLCVHVHVNAGKVAVGEEETVVSLSKWVLTTRLRSSTRVVQLLVAEQPHQSLKFDF